MSIHRLKILNCASSAKSVQLQNSSSNNNKQEEDHKSGTTMMMAQYGLDGRRIINNPNNNYIKDHSSKIGNW
jgi:hypothetical protein